MLDQIKAAVLEDMAAGRIPSTVRRFADLHDYVDANEYFLDVAGEPLGTLAELNRAATQVDQWLATL